MSKFLLTTLLLLPILCTNPGIILGIPLPYDLPNTLLKLPYHLQPFTIQSAEFTNLQIKEVTFKTTRLEYKPKSLFIKECLAVNLEVSYMRIHFDFEFEGSTGPGDYEEAGLGIYVQFDLVDNGGRPEIQTKRIQMDIGKIKVTFGGSVTDRVMSILTNFLLQPGEPIIHNQVKKIIKSQIDNLNKKFTVDFKLLNIMLDASLISPPTIQSDFVSINLNGGAYSPGTKPTPLNPPDLLKVNKTRRLIQMLVHQQVLNSALSCQFKTQPLNKSISTMSITSTIDINSQALTPVFPAMIQFDTVRDVVMRFTQNSTSVNVSNERIQVAVGLGIDVGTQEIGGNNGVTPYVDGIKANLNLNFNMLFGMLKTGVTITKLDLSSIYVNPSDITNGKVKPQSLTRYLPVLQQWISSGINAGLNTKTRSISPYGIGVAVSGSLKPKYIAMEIMI